MYIDGQFAGVFAADQYRPDVNNYFGIAGNHGYAAAIPTTYIDGRQHNLTMYAIDTYGGPNPVIGSQTFLDSPTRGNWDGANTDGYLSGWAFDPDNTSGSVQINFYANNQYVGSAVTNQYRPDVNSAYGIAGNHGFTYILPNQYVHNGRYYVQVYAVDGAFSNKGSVNTDIGSLVYPYGNQVITGGPANGSQVQISTAERFAGAISSLTWGGKQFIDSTDHGRELQSSIITDNGTGNFLGESYNPTEAGSEADGVGQTTSSSLGSISASGNQLSTFTQMAFWRSYQGRTLSNFSLTKQVTIGFQELNNVVRHVSTFWVPPEENTRVAQFETLTGYMPAEFSSFFTYNPANGAVTPIAASPNNASPMQSLPLIFSTPNGSHAMAIITERSGTLSGPVVGGTQVGYGRFTFPGQPVVKWDSIFSIFAPTGGNYVFVNDVVVGNLNTVISTLNTMQTRVPIAYS